MEAGSGLVKRDRLRHINYNYKIPGTSAAGKLKITLRLWMQLSMQLVIPRSEKKKAPRRGDGGDCWWPGMSVDIAEHRSSDVLAICDLVRLVTA
jgi:hypothetical protein